MLIQTDHIVESENRQLKTTKTDGGPGRQDRWRQTKTAGDHTDLEIDKREIITKQVENITQTAVDY